MHGESESNGPSFNVSAYIYTCMCVCERERERERDGQTEKEREYGIMCVHYVIYVCYIM